MSRFLIAALCIVATHASVSCAMYDDGRAIDTANVEEVLFISNRKPKMDSYHAIYKNGDRLLAECYDGPLKKSYNSQLIRKNGTSTCLSRAQECYDLLKKLCEKLEREKTVSRK